MAKLGCQVHLTCTSAAKVESLKNEKLIAGVWPLLLDDNSQVHDIQKIIELSQADIVVGAFPPGFRKANSGDYATKWQLIAQACQVSKVKQLLMYSSTAVYPEQASICVESDALAFNDKAAKLLQAEQALQNFKGSTLVLRLAGLYGPNRHPGRFVKHMKAVSQIANANMIHLDDVIAASLYLLQLQPQSSPSVCNLVYPNQVSKAQFYQAAIQAYPVENMSFPPVDQTLGKTVSCQLLQQLGYQFVYADSLAAIQHC
nr:hypothetical protein [Saccharobesus litoralis]